MSSRSGSETRQRTELVPVRMSTEELEPLTAAANAEGISVPELVRRRLDAPRSEVPQLMIDALADSIRAIRGRITSDEDGHIVDEVLDEFGITIEYDTGSDSDGPHALVCSELIQLRAMAQMTRAYLDHSEGRAV